MVTGSPRMLISGGTIATADGSFVGDVMVEGSTILSVGAPGTLGDAKRRIDAGGRIVLPGLVDPHVHFNDDFMGTVSVHDYRRGSEAALFGGVTSIVDFSNQLNGEPLANTLARKHEEAAGEAMVDWGIHAAITDSTPRTLDAIGAMIAAGVPTFKCYLTYRDEGLLIEDQQLLQILSRTRDKGMVLVHAEDNVLLEHTIAAFSAAGNTGIEYHAASKPVEVETSSIRRAAQLAAFVDARLYVVHVTSGEGARAVGEARLGGARVLGETCTHYLFFDDAQLLGPEGALFVCNPPFRKRADVEALWRALRIGTLSVLSTDDAAFDYAIKHKWDDRFDKVPAGLPGVEMRLPLLYSEGVRKNRMSLERLVAVCATNPARIFGFTRKGNIAPGFDADLVLLDPDAEWTVTPDVLHGGMDWTPYQDMVLTGRVESVLSRGELVVERGELVGRPGRGRFVHRTLPPAHAGMAG
jgi:dihydropyrimidinase